MDTQIEKLEILLKNFERIINAGVQLLKLNGLKLFANIFSRLFSQMVLIIIFFFFLLCLTIGGSIFLGELFGHIYLGFLSVAGFYLILGVLFTIKSKSWLEHPFGDMIVRKMTKETEL